MATAKTAAPKLTPVMKGMLTRVIDRDLGGRLVVAGHNRTAQALMRLGLAQYVPYYTGWMSGGWTHAKLTEKGAQVARDLGWDGRLVGES